MPIAGKDIGRSRDLFTFNHLDRFAGSAKSHMQKFLYPYARRSTVDFFEDFFGGTMNSNLWTANGGTGATAFAIPATTIKNGAIQGATGTNATGSNRVANLYGSPGWEAKSNCGIEIMFKSHRVSDLLIELGLIDLQTTLTTATQSVTDIDGSSATTSTWGNGTLNGAIIAMDTGQTLKTFALCALGSGTSQVGTKALIGTQAGTVDHWMVARIQLSGSTDATTMVTASLTDIGTGESGADSSASTSNAVIAAGTVGVISATTDLRPWVFIGGGSTATCLVTIGYVHLWQDRI